MQYRIQGAPMSVVICELARSCCRPCRSVRSPAYCLREN